MFEVEIREARPDNPSPSSPQPSISTSISISTSRAWNQGHFISSHFSPRLFLSYHSLSLPTPPMTTSSSWGAPKSNTPQTHPTSPTSIPSSHPWPTQPPTPPITTLRSWGQAHKMWCMDSTSAEATFQCRTAPHASRAQCLNWAPSAPKPVVAHCSYKGASSSTIMTHSWEWRTRLWCWRSVGLQLGTRRREWGGETRCWGVWGLQVVGTGWVGLVMCRAWLSVLGIWVSVSARIVCRRPSHASRLTVERPFMAICSWASVTPGTPLLGLTLMPTLTMVSLLNSFFNSWFRFLIIQTSHLEWIILFHNAYPYIKISLC